MPDEPNIKTRVNTTQGVVSYRKHAPEYEELNDGLTVAGPLTVVSGTIIAPNVPPSSPNNGTVRYVYSGNAGISGWELEDTILNAITIKNFNDLPTPSGGIIQLAANTLYVFVGSINLGNNKLKTNFNTLLFGRTNVLDKITSSNTDCTIESYSTGSFTFGCRDLSVTNTSLSGSCFDLSGSGVNFSLTNIIMFGPNGVKCHDSQALLCNNFQTSVFKTAVNFVGSTPNALLQVGAFIPLESNTKGFVFKSGSFVGNANISDVAFFTSNASQTSMYEESGSDVSGRLRSVTFRGPGTYTEGFNQTTPEWNFRDNVGVPDSRVILNSSYSDAVSNLQTVTASGDYQIPVGTLTTWNNQRFTDNLDGTYTYTGKEPNVLNIHFNVASSVAASSITVGIGVIQNGTLLSASLSSSEIDTKSGLQTSAFTVTVEENDVLKPVLANLTDTNNINLFTVQFQAND